MAKTPQQPEEIFAEIAGDYRRIFGEDLLSLILYGSGAGADYDPGKSDLNFLIILTGQGIEGLDRALETVSRWRKRRVTVPLFMTRSFLSGALDAYPIEFLNMKSRYKVVHGEDVLAPLSFDPRHIRLQLERELRGKLLNLRSGYLDTEENPGRLRELIRASLTAFVSLFGAMLFLKGAEIPEGRRAVLSAAGAAFGFDASVFLKCEEIRRKADHFSRDEVRSIFRDYLKEASRLCEIADRLEV